MGSLPFVLFASTKHLQKINALLLTANFEWQEVQKKMHNRATTNMKPWPSPTQAEGEPQQQKVW